MIIDTNEVSLDMYATTNWLIIDAIDIVVLPMVVITVVEKNKAEEKSHRGLLLSSRASEASAAVLPSSISELVRLTASASVRLVELSISSMNS